MKPGRILGAIVLAACPVSARASVEPCPAATQSSILGVWEALGPSEGMAVYRLELNPTAPSFLTLGTAAEAATFGDVVTKLDVADGNVRITLKTVNPSLVGLEEVAVSDVKHNKKQQYTTTGITVFKGFARVCGGESGLLRGTLTVEPGDPSPTTRSLVFLKNGERTLADSIKAMERRAEQLAERLGSEKRQRQEPPAGR